MHIADTTTEYTIADQKRMQAAQRYFKWQVGLASAELGTRVLEVGCGIGNFSDHLRDRESVIGIDVDENCVAQWNARFVDRSHYQGFYVNAEDPGFLKLKQYRPDSIACLNVLEHIREDKLVLHQMREVLPVGGRIVLIVPAFEALYGQIDEKLGHFRRYTRKSMGATAESAGFRIRRLKYMNTVGFFGWWANARLFNRSEQSAAQIAVFDRYVVPFMSRVEGIVSPPFGQSIITVLEKN